MRLVTDKPEEGEDRAATGSGHDAVRGWVRMTASDAVRRAVPPADGADGAPLSPAPWYRRRWAFVAAVVAIYAVARLFSAIVLVHVGQVQQEVAWNAAEHAHPYLRMTVLWDAGWYRQIVENGYPRVLPADPVTGRLWQNPIAFYPLFPYLTRALMNLTGLGFAAAGSSLSLVMGGVAAALIGLLLRDRVGPRVALAGVTLWATFMASPVLQVAYTESIAMALLCGVLYYLSRERWLAAGTVALLTGIARPIALPLGFVGCVAVFMRWRRRGRRPVTPGEWLRMFLALAACGVSGLMWIGITWVITGVPDAYTRTMTAWRAADAIEPFKPWWTIFTWISWRWFDGSHTTAALLLGGVVLLTFGLVLGPWARRLGPELRAWSFAYSLYLFASLDPSTSIFRYMLCQFPIAVVLLGQGWGAPRRIQGVDVDDIPDAGGRTGAHAVERPGVLMWALLALGVALNLYLQWWWVANIWHFTPPTDNPP